MLAFFIFAVFPFFCETADVSKIISADNSTELNDCSQNEDCCSWPGVRLAEFNMSLFAGEWYIWRDSEIDRTVNCEVKVFDVKNDNLMSSELSFFTEPNCNKHVSEKTYYKQYGLDNPGKFHSRRNVTNNEHSIEGIFQIFYTDYDSHAIVYDDCWIFTEECFAEPAILIRNADHQPMDVLDTHWVDILKSHSSNPQHFKKNHCHSCKLN